MTITAIPSSGYDFGGWEGALDGEANPATLFVSSSKTVTAVFLPREKCLLAVGANPEGGGAVSLEPPQPPDGYDPGALVTLTAVPNTGYAFGQWHGDLAESGNPATVQMEAGKSVLAVFNPTLTVRCEPPDAGSVTLDPTQPANGYPAGTLVALIAGVNAGYVFHGWEGSLSGSDSAATLLVEAPAGVVARFEATAFPWWWIAAGIGILTAVAVGAKLAYGKGRRSHAPVAKATARPAATAARGIAVRPPGR